MVDTGAVDEIEARIEALTDEAISALEGAPLPAEVREALVELARFVAWRAA